MSTMELNSVDHSPVEQSRKLATAIPGPLSTELGKRRMAAVSSAVGVTMPVFAARAGGGILGNFSKRMIVRRHQIDHRLHCGVDRFQSQNQTKGQRQQCPFNGGNRQPPASAGNDGDRSQFDPGVGLGGQRMPDAAEGSLKAKPATGEERTITSSKRS